MTQDDIMQIRVNRQNIGIMGLKNALDEMAEEYRDKPDEEVRTELLKNLSKKNYIPDRARPDYAEAFLREFKKFMGDPVDEDVSVGLVIKVLGPGCAQCDRLEKDVIEVVSELELAADFEHVTDIKEIGRYGVMGMPALIINNEVKCVGSVPPRNRIIEWLKNAEK